MNAMTSSPRSHWADLGRRPRVMLAWEHGRNYGRLSRLLAVARMVEAQGGEPIWVVPRAQREAPELVALSHRRYVAPEIEQQVFAPDFRADSFADVLLSSGFDDAGVLQAAVHAWTRAVESLQPECVVLDYAPAAQLACTLLEQRALQLTNGFDAPPASCPPYARVRPDSELGQRTAQRVAQISATIGRVAQAYAGRRDVTLETILLHPDKVYECVPETDPYGPRDGGLWVGPLGQHRDTLARAWPDDAGPAAPQRVFVHMRAMPGAVELLDALARRGAATLCFWRDAPAAVQARFCGTRVCVVSRPLPLDQVLPQADAVVSYGSTALVCRALLAGKPQLVAPTDFEKLKVAQRLAYSGAGLLWRPADSPAHEAVERLLDHTAMAGIAQGIARRYPPPLLQAQRNRFARDLIGQVEPRALREGPAA